MSPKRTSVDEGLQALSASEIDRLVLQAEPSLLAAADARLALQTAQELAERAAKPALAAALAGGILVGASGAASAGPLQRDQISVPYTQHVPRTTAVERTPRSVVQPATGTSTESHQVAALPTKFSAPTGEHFSEALLRVDPGGTVNGIETYFFGHNGIANSVESETLFAQNNPGVNPNTIEAGKRYVFVEVVPDTESAVHYVTPGEDIDSILVANGVSDISSHVDAVATANALDTKTLIVPDERLILPAKLFDQDASESTPVAAQVLPQNNETTKPAPLPEAATNVISNLTLQKDPQQVTFIPSLAQIRDRVIPVPAASAEQPAPVIVRAPVSKSGDQINNDQQTVIHSAAPPTSTTTTEGPKQQIAPNETTSPTTALSSPEQATEPTTATTLAQKQAATAGTGATHELHAASVLSGGLAERSSTTTSTIPETPTTSAPSHTETTTAPDEVSPTNDASSSTQAVSGGFKAETSPDQTFTIPDNSSGMTVGQIFDKLGIAQTPINGEAFLTANPELLSGLTFSSTITLKQVTIPGDVLATQATASAAPSAQPVAESNPTLTTPVTNPSTPTSAAPTSSVTTVQPVAASTTVASTPSTTDGPVFVPAMKHAAATKPAVAAAAIPTTTKTAATTPTTVAPTPTTPETAPAIPSLVLAPYTVETPALSKSGVTADQLNQIFAGTGLAGTGQAFVAIEQKYNVNAIYAVAHAIEESNWGNAPLAKAHNNIFGINAVDSNPNEAFYYSSYSDCIEYWGKWLAATYLTPGGQYYSGTSISAIFEHYSTDGQDEANKIVTIINENLIPKLQAMEPTTPLVATAPAATTPTTVATAPTTTVAPTPTTDGPPAPSTTIDHGLKKAVSARSVQGTQAVTTTPVPPTTVAPTTTTQPETTTTTVPTSAELVASIQENPKMAALAAAAKVSAEALEAQGVSEECLFGFDNAAEAAGLTQVRLADADEMGAQLASDSRFHEIVGISPSDFPKLPAGVVIVWSASPGHPYGHISTTLGGGQEASDFVGAQITGFTTATARVFVPNP